MYIAGNMSLAPCDNVPPARQPRSILPRPVEVSEPVSKQEMDRQRKEFTRFKTGQQLVEGINSIIAHATPAADGVKIIQSAFQLPPEDGVWLIKAINAANEWDIFNSMVPNYRDYYVKDLLKAKRTRCTQEQAITLHPPVPEVVGDDARGTKDMMAPPPPPHQSVFQTLMKMQGAQAGEVPSVPSPSQASCFNAC